MQNPFRKSDDEEIDYAKMLSGMEIGTEATRAAIIKKAISKDYIKLTKNTYTIQPNGKFLVETCKSLGIDMSAVKTAEMGKNTKDVARGKRTTEDVLKEVRAEISGIIKADKKAGGASIDAVCPKCGKKLTDNFKCLSCDCGYTLYKTVASKRLDNETIQTLLRGEKTPVIDGFKGKKGTFSAILVPSGDGKVSFEFPPKETLGNCPICGKPIIENKKAYGCSGWKDGCSFVIWKFDKYTKTKITPEQAKKLLSGEEVNTKTVTMTLTENGVNITRKE